MTVCTYYLVIFLYTVYEHTYIHYYLGILILYIICALLIFLYRYMHNMGEQGADTVNNCITPAYLGIPQHSGQGQGQKATVCYNGASQTSLSNI